MSQIVFLRCYDVQGKSSIFESFDFGEDKASANMDSLKPSAGLYALGEWLCDFLSEPDDQGLQFLQTFGFEERELDDHTYAFSLLNFYLEHYPHTLKDFQVFMGKEKLHIPQCSYNQNQDGSITEKYECQDMIGFCTILLLHLIKSGKTIKRCAYCGKWFVPRAKSDEKYCLRSLSDGKKNCRMTARYAKVLEGRNDEIIKMKKSIRQMLYNRDEPAWQFNQQAYLWGKRYKSGEVTRDEYIDWLKSHYKRKYKEKEKKEWLENL